MNKEKVDRNEKILLDLQNSFANMLILLEMIL